MGLSLALSCSLPLQVLAIPNVANTQVTGNIVTIYNSDLNLNTHSKLNVSAKSNEIVREIIDITSMPDLIEISTFNEQSNVEVFTFRLENIKSANAMSENGLISIEQLIRTDSNNPTTLPSENTDNENIAQTIKTNDEIETSDERIFGADNPVPNHDDHITQCGGVYYGPSGRETYYNLPMDGVVAIMRDLGYSEEEYPYWVREDGAKMFGDYIMVAANLETRPKGTILDCSLGKAIVCDTGTFVKTYPGQLDIAVDW